eukprot:CAMPEP_0170593722 /NCGR_PEP_ID=MMETSP0224-20130122/13611_1 /TAXON_ID=285029 /ORGANISM="Togula jolla, Strain CCCM 725" /LENGTH=48 /DNA_ID= /DNA_START= /DNA_END= /DNA_ORIENTATION=
MLALLHAGLNETAEARSRGCKTKAYISDIQRPAFAESPERAHASTTEL